MIKMNIFTIDKHDGDRKLALNINIGERQFSFVIPNYWNTSYGLGFQSNHPNKFIDNQHWIAFVTPFITFEYNHFNYNKIVHILVDEEEKYYTNQPVDSFIAGMKLWTKLDINIQKPPFSFNYEINERGKYKFYITLPKGWFLEHNLGIFETYRYPDCYMSKQEIKRLFPKYDKNKLTIHQIKKDET